MKFLLLVSLLFVPFLCWSQFRSLDHLVSAHDSISSVYPRDKLFLHRDRGDYFVGDTLWFSGYVLRADGFVPGDSLDVAYLDVIGDDGEVMWRLGSPVFWGGFSGRLVLDEDDYPQGEYTLRAYTNWMRNYGDSSFYESRFRVVDPGAGGWRVRLDTLSFEGGRFSVGAGLVSASGSPLSGREVSVRVLEGRRRRMDIRLRTGDSGTVLLDTALHSIRDARNLVLEVVGDGGLDFRVPVSALESKAPDLQFLPEGGTFVGGISQKAGFKAVNIYGNGVDVRGTIEDSSGATITSFTSVHRGMGTVSLTPVVGERYTAVLENSSRHPLPEVQSSGTVLRVENDAGSDSIVVWIDASADLYGRVYHFTAEARETVGIRGTTPPLAGPYEHSFAKSLFPSGVVRFTLYDQQLSPLNGRSVFIWHGDALDIDLSADREVYGLRDSVGLSLHVRDAQGIPVGAGMFSVSVVDTSQTMFHELGDNLLANMLLGSNLSGEVEDPYYYLLNPSSPATDALLLTQGWVRYARRADSPIFARERGFSVAGRVVNMLGRPISGSGITLMGRSGSSGMLVMDTVTNADGGFLFSDFQPFATDSMLMVLKALNRRDRAHGIRIELEEQSFPGMGSLRSTSDFTAGRMLVDTSAQRLVEMRTRMLGLANPGSIMLDEAVVTAQARVPGSRNLNPGGGADQVILRDAFENTPKKTLLDLLYEHVDGFGMQYVEGEGLYIPGDPGVRSRGHVYTVGQHFARVVVDGMDLSRYYVPADPDWNPYILGSTVESFDPRGYMEFLKPLLDQPIAYDLAGVEVMSTLRYKGRYHTRHLTLTQMEGVPMLGPRGLTFIEVTTLHGNGLPFKQVPGEYRYFPVIPVVSPEFYSPRYARAKPEVSPPDTRATVYWEPRGFGGR